MARQKSRPSMMIVGGLLFLVMPVLWARASNAPLNWRLMIGCSVIAIVFFYLAAKYSRLRRDASAIPPAA
jgi:hypothetical protein